MLTDARFDAFSYELGDGVVTLRQFTKAYLFITTLIAKPNFCVSYSCICESEDKVNTMHFPTKPI